MSQYGGYSKGGYGGGGDDAGGFVYGSQQQGSQSTRNYADESLRPITIKQIISAEETSPVSGEFRLDGQMVTQVTFVAQVRQLNVQPTNIQFRLDDGTAVIEVKKYIDTDRAEDMATAQVEVGEYIRVYGRLKSFNNKRYVHVHFIRAIADYNEVNYHLLEATAVHLYYTRGALGGAGQVKTEGGAGGNDSLFVGNDGYGGGGGGSGAAPMKLTNASPLAQKVFQCLLNEPGGTTGVNMQVICQKAGMSPMDVQNGADELLGQGVIYTTVDDETWALLEY